MSKNTACCQWDGPPPRSFRPRSARAPRGPPLPHATPARGAVPRPPSPRRQCPPPVAVGARPAPPAPPQSPLPPLARRVHVHEHAACTTQPPPDAVRLSPHIIHHTRAPIAATLRSQGGRSLLCLLSPAPIATRVRISPAIQHRRAPNENHTK